MANDLSLLFESTAELYTLSPIQAVNGMPAGWRIHMPMGDRHVTADLFTLEQGVRGAYKLHLSQQSAMDDWQLAAIALLEHILAVIATEGLAMTDTVAENVACEFHTAWTTGAVVVGRLYLRSGGEAVVDTTGMRWVTVGQGVERGR
ncbi:hypothetical protein [Rhizobium leguminosarum]